MRVILPEYYAVVDEDTNQRYSLDETFSELKPVVLQTEHENFEDIHFVDFYTDEIMSKLVKYGAKLDAKVFKNLLLTLIRTKPLVFAILALEQEFPITDNYYEANKEMPYKFLAKDEVREEVRKTLASLFQVAFITLKFEVENHIANTPYRLAKMLLPDNSKENELLSGRWNKPPEVKSFSDDQDDIDFAILNGHTHGHQVSTSVLLNRVVITTVQINSLCAHHFVPYGTVPSNPKSKAIVAYIPKEKVLGLSKISRIVNWLARRPSVQETLTKQIAKTIDKLSNGYGTLVLLKDLEHGCLVRRGRNDTLGLMTTTYATGIFLENEKLKTETLKLMKQL